MKRRMIDSGVAWIDEVPEGWRLERFCNFFSFRKGLDITKSDLTEEGVAVISYGQIHSKKNPGVHLLDELLRYVPRSTAERNITARVSYGDIVFADTSEDVEGAGNCVYIDTEKEVYAGYHDLIAHPCDPDSSHYVAYLLQADPWRSQIRAKVNGIKVYSITQKLFKGVTLLLPPPSEQRRIAAYLDRECAKIDSLAAEVSAQIAALEEYRKSIIIEVVTKGLNPGVRMKDSGVEWIGKVPETWKVTKLKHYVCIHSGDGIKNEDLSDDGEYEVWGGGDSMMGHFGEYNVDGSNLIVGRVGSCGLVKRSIGKRFISDNALVVNMQFESISFDFMYYNLIAADLRRLNTSTAQPLITATKVNNVRVPLPPIHEQRFIASYLDQECSRIDSTIAECKQQLDSLAEYRKSLIYECVTGKREVA